MSGNIQISAQYHNVRVFVFVLFFLPQMLSHANIVRFFGHRKEGLTMYLFLEYCSGGELFDRIGETYKYFFMKG